MGRDFTREMLRKWLESLGLSNFVKIKFTISRGSAEHLLRAGERGGRAWCAMNAHPTRIHAPEDRKSTGPADMRGTVAPVARRKPPNGPVRLPGGARRRGERRKETVRWTVSAANARSASGGLGVRPAPSVWEIGARLPGLARNAPAGGRQARPDLSRDKSGEGGARWFWGATARRGFTHRGWWVGRRGAQNHPCSSWLNAPRASGTQTAQSAVWVPEAYASSKNNYSHPRVAIGLAAC